LDEQLIRRFPRLRLVQHPAGRGFGAALRAGLAKAHNPLLMYAPADGSYQPADLDRLLKWIDRADLVVGRRVGPVGQHPVGWRDRGYRWLIRVLFGLRLSDLGCRFLLARRAIFARIPIQSDGIFAHLEVLVKANFLGCLMTETRVAYRHPEGATKEGGTNESFTAELYRVFSQPDFGPPFLPPEATAGPSPAPESLMPREIQLGPQRTMVYDDSGQGPAVILLHGFPLSPSMWQPQAEDFAADHRVILPDLRALGERGPVEQSPSIEQMADDVAALLDKLGIQEPVALGGLSMGGYVALAFARKHPGRLRGLVLADTRAEADTEEGRANRDRMIALAAAEGPVAVVDQMIPKLLGEQTKARRPEVTAELRRMGERQSTAQIAGALRALRDRPDARPGLAVIAVPTLVIVGQEDVLTPPALSEALAAAIPGARLVVLEGAGHISNLEQPEAFNRALRAFLQSLD
jgi:pimeloyl-ACP methyl ester carboxylesterase